MVEKLEETRCEFVFADCDIIDAEGKIIEAICAPKNYQQAIWGGNFVGACFMYTRVVYESIGEYDPELYLVEDYDYWLRIFARYKVAHIKKRLYGYRRHDGTLSSTEKQERINSVLEKVLLKNFPNTSTFTWLDKYYLYVGLDKCCSLKENLSEKNKYKMKLKRYSILYLCLWRVPKKVRRILFKR